MDEKFTLLNLISIILSDFKYKSLEDITENEFFKFFSTKKNIGSQKNVILNILNEYSYSENKLFKQKKIKNSSEINLYCLNDDFQINFYNEYILNYKSNMMKDDLVLWILNGRQFLFEQNIVNSFQEYYIKNSGIINSFFELKEIKGFKNFYLNEINNQIFYIKQLEEEHIGKFGRKRLRIRGGPLRGIKDYMIKSNIQKLNSISLYWTGEGMIFSFKMNHNVDELIERISPKHDGRLQSIPGYNLFVTDSISNGVIGLGDNIFHTKDYEQIVSFINTNNFDLIDKSTLSKVLENIIELQNLENYVSITNKNIENSEKIRSLSIENSKNNLIGMIGEFALINYLIENDEKLDETNVHWIAEENYGSNYDVFVSLKNNKAIYEVKTTTNEGNSITLSSREYDELSKETNNSFFVKVLIDDEIVVKYSEISNKKIWSEYVKEDILHNKIKISIYEWNKIKELTSPYKYRVKI